MLMTRVLADPSTDFSSIRGKRIGSNHYLANIDLPGKYLDCDIQDWSDNSVPQLAAVKEASHEQADIKWDLDCQSLAHPVPIAALADWLQHVLAPSLPATLSPFTTGAPPGGPQGRVVSWGDPKTSPTTVEMIAADSGGPESHSSTYLLEIEHHAKAAHASPPPALSTTDKRPMTAQAQKEIKAIADFIRLGLLEAPGDFKNIRGKLLNPGEESADNPQYVADVPFAMTFHVCRIDLTGLWDFWCGSAVFDDVSYEATVAFVKQAVVAGLPDGFTFQPTPGDVGELNWRGPGDVWVHAKTIARECRPYLNYYEVSVNKRSP
jgi:hypothetical protein